MCQKQFKSEQSFELSLAAKISWTTQHSDTFGGTIYGPFEGVWLTRTSYFSEKMYVEIFLGWRVFSCDSSSIVAHVGPSVDNEFQGVCRIIKIELVVLRRL